MINHGNRGVPSFRIQISPFSYECPVSCPSTVHEPPKLESHHSDNQSPPLPPLKGNSRHMPGESLHAAAPSQCLVIVTTITIINIIIIILLITIIIRLEIRIFRHPFSKYPTAWWKWQVRASMGTAKRNIGVCANTDRVFFPARCVCLTMYTSKWLFKWTKWWATMDIVGCSLFGSRYLLSALNVQFHAPPKWTLVTCLVRLFTQQPLRSVSSSASSSSSTSSFDLQFGFFDIHLPRTQRCDESDRFEHPFRYRKSDFGVCANTDRVFFPARCVRQTIYLQMAL